MATALDDALLGDTLTDDTPPPSSSSSAAAAGGGIAAGDIVAAFDPSVLAECVANLAVLVLSASRDDLLQSLLAYPDTVQKCSRFASDASSQSLYLTKDSADTTLPSASQNGTAASLLPSFLCATLSLTW